MVGVNPVELLVFVVVSLGFIATVRRPRTPRQMALAAILYVFIIGLSIVIGNGLVTIASFLVESAPYLCLIVSVVVFGFIQVIARKPTA